MSSIFTRGSSDGRISYEEFSSAVTASGYPEPPHSTHWSFLNEARNTGIFEKQELAMLLAHFIHDSEGFVEKREKVNLSDYNEESPDPSCDYPGQAYFGRGYLKVLFKFMSTLRLIVIFKTFLYDND